MHCCDDLTYLRCCTQLYAGRGFLTRLLTASSDLAKLADIDDQLTKCINDMQLALHVQGLELQQASYEKLFAANEEILTRIRSCGGPEVRAAV